MFVKEEETTHAVKPLKALSITHKSTEWKFVLKLFLTNEWCRAHAKVKMTGVLIQSSPFQALKWRSREEKAEQKTVETM